MRKLLMMFGVIALTTAAASTAAAAGCVGLACPGVLPVGSPAQSPLLPVVSSSRDLSKIRTSGYYAYSTAGLGSLQAVAYVVAAGDWSAAPQEIKQLPLADALLPAERTTKWMVIYGPGAMESGPWGTTPTATVAGAVKRRSPQAHAAAASDCVAPWFCVFTNTSWTGNKCQWMSLSTWQGLGSCTGDEESMVNRRNAWSLIKRISDNRNYCAIPNSQDASLANNGFSNNSDQTYNSTSTSKLSAWDCAN